MVDDRTLASGLQTTPAQLSDMSMLEPLYDAVSESVLVLNHERQVVFCNRAWAQLLGVQDRREIYGRRPGEAMNCIHSGAPHGCGEGDACKFCGTLQSALAGQEGKADVREAQILRGRPPEAMDVLVRTTPLEIGGERFIVAALTDISHLKRRRALERIFFHDVMNTVASMRLVADLLPQIEPKRIQELAGKVGHGVRRLMEEIASQRDLMSAEGNELAVRPLDATSVLLLRQVVEDYSELATPRRCRVTLDDTSDDLPIRTDITILSRVLGNMIKNAIEASEPGDVITAGCEGADGGVRFYVHNRAFIPQDVQLQLFKRSFSTKGSGRGLGTYSMLLLSEKYLKGTVSFTSTQAEGTKFFVAIPAKI